MRAVSAHIQQALESGVFVGDTRVSGRVTVEPNWFLNTETNAVGKWPKKKTPLRWFQREDNSQVEVEIPNVRSIQIDRQIDQPAAALQIKIMNQKMTGNTAGTGIPDELGQPGYFTFSRGQSPESVARWGQDANDWAYVIVQNSLVRTYQGYGGADKTLTQAQTDGNIMLTGAFLIDSVHIATDGTINLRGRDMMKLLIEQQLYLPLVPEEEYPLTYQRWVYTNDLIRASARDATTVSTSSLPPGDRGVTYADSSGDHWYGFNASIHGHSPSDSLDGDPNTFWLSVGNSGPDMPFATDWIEYDCGGQSVNAVYVAPWAGNYTMFVSVMENGNWQGYGVVPYDPSILFATQSPAVDTGAFIPQVEQFGVPWETPQEYVLPRVYAAQRIRISFRHESLSPWGPWYYRCGIREFRARIGTGGSQNVSTVSSVHQDPSWLCADQMPGTYPTSGYITCDGFGQVDAFGDARVRPATGGNAVGGSDAVIACRMTPSGKGYYLMDFKGRVQCFGDAVFHGDFPGNNISAEGTGVCWDMAVTPSGGGYWIIQQNGTIQAFGDAHQGWGPVPISGDNDHAAVSIECDGIPGGGIWVLINDGTIFNFGTLGHGNAPGHVYLDNWHRLRRTHTGGGYWVVSAFGHVHAGGDATFWGNVGVITNSPAWTDVYWAILPGLDGLGYNVMRGDGHVYPIGTVANYGSPTPGGQGQLRDPGNYLDYSDIITDLLLWSGFWLKENLGPGDMPAVFGSIETTGAYGSDILPADMFDKRPVIDAINAIKEIVGYIVYVDEEGGFHFESPNWWQSGNFLEDGTHTNAIVEIDERNTLTQYSVELPDGPIRSPIIITSELVDKQPGWTQHVSFTPPTARLLRGMVEPAMWVNGYFTNPNEQLLMAELIALHIWFQLRLGSVTAWCDPSIQLNDQVRILERQTSETYIHYVRGISTVMDLEAGTWNMTLTTNWLGDSQQWAITSQSIGQILGGGILPLNFPVSDALLNWMKNGQRKVRTPELLTPVVPPYTYVAPPDRPPVQHGPIGAADGVVP